MRAVLYARFSTDLQREESIDDQFRACQRVADAAGFIVVDRYKDEGISGGTADRPGYQELLAAARRGEFDVIVTEDISRLWRSRSEFGPRSAELEDLGLHLVTCVGDDTRRDGWGLIIGIKQAIAEAQRREISYRTRRGLEGLALAGKKTGGRCYGDRPGEPEIVRRIFAAADAGWLPSQIANSLNQERIRAPRSRYWSINTIKRVLANPRYAGRFVWGATESKGGAQDSRRKRHVMRSEGPLVVRQIEPMVDPALFARVQEQLHASLQNS